MSAQCYCRCSLPKSRSSPFHNKHQKRWLDHLVDQALPAALAGEWPDAVVQPHDRLFGKYPALFAQFEEALQRRVDIACEGWAGQQGQLLPAAHIADVLAHLRVVYWHGQEVYHDELGYGRVTHVLDASLVEVSFDRQPEALWTGPTAELALPNVHPEESE